VCGKLPALRYVTCDKSRLCATYFIAVGAVQFFCEVDFNLWFPSNNCYFTLVRSVVEHGYTISDPHNKKDIRKSEKINRRAARIVTKYD